MLDSLKMYRAYAAQSLKSQLEYRGSFIFQGLAQFFLISAEYLGVWSLFHRFGSIGGWSLEEISLFYGMVSIGFALSQTVSGGFERAGELIRSGELDRILTRPRSTELQLFGMDLSLRRSGRLVTGILVLLYGIGELKLEISLPVAFVFFWTLAGTASLFCGLMLIQAGISIWTIETLEIMNTLTYGGQETARYPLPVYSAPFRRFFTYVVPLGCVSYYPVLFILGKADPLGSPSWIQPLTPAAGFLFFAAALLFWRFALRHYQSTGS